MLGLESGMLNALSTIVSLVRQDTAALFRWQLFLLACSRPEPTSVWLIAYTVFPARDECGT